ncbi:MAG: hypothetical protein JW931_08925 [Methanomicrobiaceae archaeon]|nr:hypothetical protein [Methanomicrobiaceae archaeon]
MSNERLRENTLKMMKYCREKITKIFSDFESGSMSAGELSLPLYCKCRIARYIKMLETDGGLHPELNSEYNQITTLIESFIHKFGNIYYDLLYEELKERVNCFYSLVLDGYIDFEDDPIETSNDLASRELIELALIELEGQSFDLREINHRIFISDEKLKDLYWEGKDFIIEKDIMDYFERPYYPDRFWFYHPVKLFEELERRKRAKE